jgi:ribosomal protein L12E/L44/L45/RPP1/RPP2
VDIKPLLGKLGVNVDEVMKMVGEQATAKPAAGHAEEKEKKN